ncbi:MAG: GDP-mannose 4,6-dehydratase, partial [Flavobacteriaceae bacterium]|nr:GDP-mannose 4,6-dehydratase [Flavobacteriaceae bacterium]
GEGIEEKGVDSKTSKVLVEVDEKYFRPSEVVVLLGNPAKAEKELGWKRQISFQKLVSDMVKYDLENDDFGGQE